MMWIDTKYVSLVSGRLEKFHQKRPGLWNFRCCFCGDSAKNRSRCRAFLIAQDGTIQFYCHNCNASFPLGKFLKEVDPFLSKEYQRELFLEKLGPRQPSPLFPEPEDPVAIENVTPFQRLQSVEQLDKLHPARVYVAQRRIPLQYRMEMRWAPHYHEFMQELTGEENSIRPHGRLIIPFFDKDNNLHAIQARALGSETPKYLTTIINPDVPKVYGFNRMDASKRIYVVEGPIDSMFIPNCLAMAGADFAVLDGQNKDEMTIVFDNEPRNKQIVARMEKMLKSGWPVCIWPTSPDKKEDINDLINRGLTSADIKKLIDNNTYSGLAANVAMMKWKRC